MKPYLQAESYCVIPAGDSLPSRRSCAQPRQQFQAASDRTTAHPCSGDSTSLDTVRVGIPEEGIIGLMLMSCKNVFLRDYLSISKD